jgi:hypothetical protein
VEIRLHRGGQFRRWLGARFGGGFELGNRVWRRTVHVLGVAVLVYFVIPDGFFLIVPKAAVLLTLLFLVLLAESLRHLGWVDVPMVRAYEAKQIGAYATYAVALTAAVLLLPEAIAAAVVLGTALVDPLLGELRDRPSARAYTPWVPVAVYAALAFVSLVGIGGWPWGVAALLSAGAAVVGVAAEYPRIDWLDDDLLMTAAPAVFLYVVGAVVLGLPR